MTNTDKIYSIEIYENNPHAENMMRIGNSSRKSTVVIPMRWKEAARFETNEQKAIELFNQFKSLSKTRLIETYTGAVLA